MIQIIFVIMHVCLLAKDTPRMPTPGTIPSEGLLLRPYGVEFLRLYMKLVQKLGTIHGANCVPEDLGRTPPAAGQKPAVLSQLRSTSSTAEMQFQSARSQMPPKRTV